MFFYFMFTYSHTYDDQISIYLMFSEFGGAWRVDLLGFMVNIDQSRSLSQKKKPVHQFSHMTLQR